MEEKLLKMMLAVDAASAVRAGVGTYGTRSVPLEPVLALLSEQERAWLAEGAYDPSSGQVRGSNRALVSFPVPLPGVDTSPEAVVPVLRAMHAEWENYRARLRAACLESVAGAYVKEHYSGGYNCGVVAFPGVEPMGYNEDPRKVLSAEDLAPFAERLQQLEEQALVKTREEFVKHALSTAKAGVTYNYRAGYHEPSLSPFPAHLLKDLCDRARSLGMPELEAKLRAQVADTTAEAEERIEKEKAEHEEREAQKQESAAALAKKKKARADADNAWLRENCPDASQGLAEGYDMMPWLLRELSKTVAGLEVCGPETMRHSGDDLPEKRYEVKTRRGPDPELLRRRSELVAALDALPRPPTVTLVASALSLVEWREDWRQKRRTMVLVHVEHPDWIGHNILCDMESEK